MALLFACTNNPKEKTISIIDLRDSINPVDNVDNHRDKDVVISRVQITEPKKEGKAYSISMYRMKNGKLTEDHPFIVVAKDDYEKATYKWINDSVLTFKLINSTTNQSENFKITNKGENASISRE